MNFLQDPPASPDNPEPVQRACQYPTCPNRVAIQGMQYCEACRILAMRNSIVICLDPFAPMTERYDSIFHTMYHNMTTEEKINATAKAEHWYLQFLKMVTAEKLQLRSTKRTFSDLENELEEARSASPHSRSTRKEALKIQAKHDKRNSSIRKLVGDDPEAKKWFDENVDF